MPQTRDFLRRELEHVSRLGGGGSESSWPLAPSLLLFRCFLFGRAISVFSERFFNRLRPKKNNCNFLGKICQIFADFAGVPRPGFYFLEPVVSAHHNLGGEDKEKGSFVAVGTWKKEKVRDRVEHIVTENDRVAET